MAHLTRYENSGIELVINIQTGEAFSSIRGYARMSGKAESTIRERCNGARKNEIKEAQIDTVGGLQGARLIPAELVFEWLMKDNTELAKAMGKAGATVYLHQLAGYKVSSNVVEVKPQLPQTYLEALKALVESEETKEKLAFQNSILEAQITDLEQDNERQAEIIDELFNYSSIVRIAKLNKVSEKNFNWRRLKSTCEVLKLEILQAPDSKFGVRNLYPHEAWGIAYPDVKLPKNTQLVKVH